MSEPRTEVIPGNIPEWAEKAMEEGTFFKTCLNRPISFKHARMTMRKGLKEPALREGYRANIAMCIYDNRHKDGRLNAKDCNAVAEELITIIFGRPD